jgi:CCR4-NOT transcriptional regulation complex NOT5 subunit
LRDDKAAQKSNKENHHNPAHADAPMGRSQGKQRLMSPAAACVNFHPFTETLREWEEGVPVDCGEDWTLAQIEAAIAQGPHQSAMTPESLELIQEDIAYQVRAGYAEVVEWAWLKDNLPAQLKISPLAVVPQANRRGRMILDLSFPVLRKDKQSRGRKRKRAREARDVLRASVNDSTIRLAPEAPVKELGNVLKRLL